MHGGFGGGGGGGFGHSGGGHHGGHNGGHNGGHSGGHSGGHQQPMAHDGGHPMHSDHHHHAGGHKDDKGGASKGQGQSLFSHATSLVQNGHGILGHIAAALTGHNTTTGHNAGAGQSMHLDQYLSPLQAEKKDSSDQVGNPGALSHPDNLVLNGMVSKRTHNEPRIVLAAIFAGLMIWMLVVQLFNGGGPGRPKKIATNPLLQQSLSDQDIAAGSSVAPILSLLSMAESHGHSSGIAQSLMDDPNSDPNEATQSDSPSPSSSSSSSPADDNARESTDNDRENFREQADLRNESPADSEKNSDSSAQLAAAMQIFQPRATASAGAGTATTSAMVAPASQNSVSMRAISQGAPVSARMTARTTSNLQPTRATASSSGASNLLQAETLQKSAQETFAAGSFGGPRALSSDEPILIGTAPKVPGAASVLRVQKPGSQISPSLPQPLLSAADTQTNSDPASFASLFVPAENNATSAFKHAPDTSNTRRRWRATPVGSHHSLNSARSSTIADAAIYTNSPVDDLGHSRKRVVTDR